MTRLQELLDLHAKESARIQAERAAEKETQEAEARAKALAFNVALREKGRELLGALFDELAPAEAVASESPIPLNLGPGPVFLYLAMRFYQTKGILPTLIVDSNDRSADYLCWLPASEKDLAEAVAMAVRARKDRRRADWDSLQSDYYEDNDERRTRVEFFSDRWPDLAGKAHTWLDGVLAQQAERAAARAAKSADTETPAPETVTPPTDADIAFSLVRQLVDLVHVHESQE